MKAYSTLLSLAGAAIFLAGGLAYLLNSGEMWLVLVNVVLGLAAIVVAGLLNPDLFRQYSLWLNAVWGGITVLAIIVMVNFLADRYPQRLDATAGKLHSLSELTVESLQRLETEVQALAFIENGEHEDLESLLKQYAVHGSNFSFELVDPDRDPERTNEYGIRSYNTLVVESGSSQQKVTELTEKQITNALLKVVRNRQEVVYMTVGHGEKGVVSRELGYSRFKERLEEIDYVLEDSLFLAREGRVPEDCAVVIIAGPQSPFLEPEVEALRAYLSQGGSVLVLLDPLYEIGLGQLFREWGIVAGDDFVIDTSGLGSLMGLDFTTPVAVSYDKEHLIVRKHRRGVMSFFELARSVHLVGGKEGYLGAELVMTSDESWGETDLTVLQANPGKQTVKLDEGVDRPGPVPLAAAVHDSAGAGGRLVVFGDSDFASNRYFDLQGNGDLALNALSWLAEDEELISIRPREPGFNPIALTERQSAWIFWVSVIAFPLGVAAVGFFVVSRKGRWSLRELATVGLGIVLSLGVVVLVNYISESYHSRFDMTEDQLYTLSSDTRDLLSRVDDEGKYVSVKTFMAETDGMRFQDTMDEYKSTTRRFDYEVIDPQKAALVVKQYGIRERGTSIVEVTGDGEVQSERFTEQTEEALSNAIQRSLKAVERRIAFTGGHGEGELTQVDGEGFSILNGRLKEMNFEIEEGLRLATGVKPGALVVAVVAPSEPFSPDEEAALRAHMERGGEALLLLDPGQPTGLEALLRDYSVELGQDFVVDLSGIGQLLGADVSVPVVIQYGDHTITEKIASGTMSFFPFSRSVSVDDLGGGMNGEAKALLITHPSSWGEVDLSPLTGEGDKVEYDPESDRPGPLTLAVAVKADADSAAVEGDMARLVVFGDSDFANNQYFGQQANGELLVSSLRWLVEGENKLSIPARIPRFSPINLVGNQGDWVLWISVFILPLVVAMSGFVIMLRRGYETYSAGFVSWLIYSFLGLTFFFFAQAVVGLSEGSFWQGEGFLLLTLISAAVAYGLFRRDHRVWPIAVGLAVANVGLGFVAIPNETLQLAYAGLFAANACILIWIKREIVPTKVHAPAAG